MKNRSALVGNNIC